MQACKCFYLNCGRSTKVKLIAQSKSKPADEDKILILITQNKLKRLCSFFRGALPITIKIF